MTEKDFCAICYEPYEKDKIKIVLECNHYFHFNCLKKWIEQAKDTCPLCRGKTSIELTSNKKEEGGIRRTRKYVFNRILDYS